MHISSVTLRRLRIPFKVSFVHALKSRTETDTLILTLTSSDGITGLGEILPRPYLTGEGLDDVLTVVPAIASRWLLRMFDDRDDILAALQEEMQRAGRMLATLAGWELALVDLAGKTFGFEAGDILGPVLNSSLESGAVIDLGIPTAALKKYCVLLRLRGQHHVKVKVGHDHENDLRRLSIISDVFGDSYPLRIDANGVWTPWEAVKVLNSMRHFNISSVEQPVGARDLHGMRTVREETGLRVMADESLCSLKDAERLIELSAADIFNIRIAKCGGLLSSLRLIKLAQQAGLQCHLGTLVGETGILSRAAEILGERVEGFECLEGKGQNKTLLLRDIVEVAKPGPGASHGLGIRLATENPPLWSASAHTVYRLSQGANP